MNRIFEKGVTLLELTVVLLVLVALAGLVVPYVGGTGQMARCQATDATMIAVKEAVMGGASGSGFYGDLLGQYPAGTKQIPSGNGSDFNLKYLFEKPSWAQAFNIKTAVGWRNPYLQNGRIAPTGLDSSFTPTNAFNKGTSSTFGNKVHESISTGAQVMDAWNRPIVLQVPCEKATASATTCTLNFDYARLVSAGPGSGIQPGDAAIDTKIAYDGSNTTEVLNVRDAGNRGDDRVLYLQRPDPYVAGNTPCNQL